MDDSTWAMMEEAWKAARRVRARQRRIFDLHYARFLKCSRCGQNHGMPPDHFANGDRTSYACGCGGWIQCVGYAEGCDER